MEKKSGKVIKLLRTSQGGEFTSRKFTDFCEENCIREELTAPYTPDKKAGEERKNRTMVEMARSMLKAKGVSCQFWEEAVADARCLS